jgi:type I restriction enzyme M protein
MYAYIGTVLLVSSAVGRTLPGRMDTRSDRELQAAKDRMRPAVVDLLHALRGGGLPNPMAALEQLSLLLLVWQLAPATWDQLMASTSASRFERMRKLDFPDLLLRPGVGGDALREAMMDATFLFPSAQLLDLVIHRLHDLLRGEYACADLLDAALDEVSVTSSVGSPRTPPVVSNCMITLTEPRTGDLVFDPAAGAGDRLLSVIRRASAGSRNEGARVSGVDLDSTIVRLGVMSLVFHGILAPNLYTRNVLAEPPDSAQRFDVILCQPPFGNRIDPSMLAQEFRDIPNARSEVLFAELTLNRLAPAGRAAIVLPANVAFSKGVAPMRLRKRLLERLRAVITLPQGTFQPHANVDTFVVALGLATDHVVFVDARDEERGKTSQSVEILRRSGAIVDDLLDDGLPVEELPSYDRDRVFVVHKDAIRDNGYSLLPSTYRPLHETSGVTDSPLVLFREIERAEAEITQHLAELGRRLAERPPRDG